MHQNPQFQHRHQRRLPSIEREVAGLLGSEVYPGKQLAPFADDQPMLITSLLLNAAACHLKDPSVCGDPALAPHNALHLAAAAIVLQPRNGKAFYRAACALGKLGAEGDLKNLRAAHAIMRYAARLRGEPAAELLAHLPPLPLGAVAMPFNSDTGAMYHLLPQLCEWSRLMRERAPAGQDFLLQLPGGLGELPPHLAYAPVAACDAEVNVGFAMDAQERGNDAFHAGDTTKALREYRTGIDYLRPLVAMHLQRNGQAISQAMNDQMDADPTPSDPEPMVVMVRNTLANVIWLEMFPYHPEGRITLIRNQASGFFSTNQLAPAIRLPGRNNMAALVGSFWSQLVVKFMEPYGGMEGPLRDNRIWPHPVVSMARAKPDFCPFP
jgi:hypothetical protein